MPTEKPYRVNDRRRIHGWGEDPWFSEPVRKRYTGERRNPQNYDKDAPQLVGRESRRALMSFGRELYQNASIVRGALNEMASLATSSFIPQFDGDDVTWGDTAEDWLYEHDRVCDVRGHPYNMDSINRLLVLSVLRDGDCFVLLTEAENGWPMFQIVPAHRVGARGNEGQYLNGGPFAGYAFNDGCVINPYGRVVAYKVLGESEESDRIIDSASLVPAFQPSFADQIRGFSALACAVIDFQDVHESRRLELVSQKLLAALTLVESNETGMADSASEVFTGITTSTTPAEVVHTQEHYGGEVRVFRAGTGSKIEAVTGDRPTYNQQQFAESILRQAVHGLGWSYDYSVDPTKVGGALGRVVVDKINRRLNEIRQKILAPVRRRMDGYRIAKAINLGLIPPSDEWMKWTYQGPGDITADRKHSSDVDRQEYQMGFATLSEIQSRRGAWWQDTVRQKAREARFITEEAERNGVPVDMIQMLTPNGNPASAQPDPEDDNEDDTSANDDER